MYEINSGIKKPRFSLGLIILLLVIQVIIFSYLRPDIIIGGVNHQPAPNDPILYTLEVKNMTVDLQNGGIK